MFGWFNKKNVDDMEEEDLKKQGFDPLSDDQTQPVAEQAGISYEYEDDNYLDLTQPEIVQAFVTFKPFQYRDNYRHPLAHPKGGVICADQKIIQLERQVAKDILKQIGRKILNGDFNLTKIPFPIKISLPKSGLQTAAESTMLFPLYLNLATMDPYPKNRFIYTMMAFLGSQSWQTSFLKPVNPILGETLEASYNDDSKVYAEQISHHPPITYVFMEGMNKAYRFYGYYHVEASAGLNSLYITNKGKRKIVFKDGQTIDITFAGDQYKGTFVGSTRQILTGKVKFTDVENEIRCEIVYGKNSSKPADHFEGQIYFENKKAGFVEGSYLSYINVDNVRYFDIRNIKPHKLQYKVSLESDHQIRPDLISLKNGDLEDAQLKKDKLEDHQRNDKKLRDKAKKK